MVKKETKKYVSSKIIYMENGRIVILLNERYCPKLFALVLTFSFS